MTFHRRRIIRSKRTAAMSITRPATITVPCSKHLHIQITPLKPSCQLFVPLARSSFRATRPLTDRFSTLPMVFPPTLSRVPDGKPGSSGRGKAVAFQLCHLPNQRDRTMHARMVNRVFQRVPICSFRNGEAPPSECARVGRLLLVLMQRVLSARMTKGKKVLLPSVQRTESGLHGNHPSQ